VRRVPESEVESEFERQYAWGDDERNFYHPLKKKAAVLGCHLRLETVVSLVKRYVKPSGRALGRALGRVADFASAQGNYALALAEAGYDVTAVDINEEFLRYARKKYEHGKFTTVQANIIGYRDGARFDGLILGEVLEHVAHPGELLKSAFENLRPGGFLFITTPNGAQHGQKLPTFSQVTDFSAFEGRQFHWGNHLFLYTPNELRGLFDAAGFEVLEMFGVNSDYVSQIKGVRFLLPYFLLRWMERRTRTWRIRGHESTNTLVAVGRKRQNSALMSAK